MILSSFVVLSLHSGQRLETTVESLQPEQRLLPVETVEIVLLAEAAADGPDAVVAAAAAFVRELNGR